MAISNVGVDLVESQKRQLGREQERLKDTLKDATTPDLKLSDLRKDRDWVKKKFILPVDGMRLINSRNLRRLNSAAFKWADTTPGGNRMINPLSQYSIFVDPPIEGVDRTSEGMGELYSRTIDDNAQVINMSFGVPAYNGFARFFTNFFDSSASLLLRTGRTQGVSYILGRIAGFILLAPVLPLILLGTAVSFLNPNSSSTSFMSFKETMHLYWNTVNGILNGIITNMQAPMPFNPKDVQRSGYGSQNGNDGQLATPFNVDGIPQINEWTITSSELEEFYKFAESITPGLFLKSGGIDAYVIATRGTRKLLAAYENESLLVDDGGAFTNLQNNIGDYVDGRNFTPRGSTIPTSEDNDSGEPTLGDVGRFVEKEGVELYGVAGFEGQMGEVTTFTGENGVPQSSNGWWSRYARASNAVFRQGGKFIGLRVDHTGTSSISINNSLGESQFAEKVNAKSKQARNTMNSYGTTGVPGLDGIITSLNQFFTGVTESIGIDGINALLGKAYADIPKEWIDGETSFPTSTYTIKLRSPRGDPISKILKIWLPLSMIMAGAAARSAGKHAYDAPFICQLFDKGRNQVREGMITSVSVSLGEGNIGWSKTHEPLGVDVNFTVTDLATNFHVPVNADPSIFTEHSKFSDMLAVMGSLSLADQLIPRNRMRLSILRKKMVLEQRLSPERFAFFTGSTLPPTMLLALGRAFLDPENRAEAAISSNTVGNNRLQREVERINQFIP